MRTAKEYYQGNKEKILLYNKNYRDDNKDIIKFKDKNRHSVKIKCECNSFFIKKNINRHKKSEKHINYQNGHI